VLAVFASGLHATVAGILVALMVPMKIADPAPALFVEIVRTVCPSFDRGD